MEDYNKIIESLGVRFIKAKKINVVQAVTIENYYDVENTVILVTAGSVGFGKAGKETIARDGEILFVPGGKSVRLSYGSSARVSLTNDEFISRKELYIQTHSDGSSKINDGYSYVTFEAKVFNSVNFFASLDIESFVIKSNDINYIIRQILTETISESPGKNRVVKLKTEHLVIEIIRHIVNNNLFVEQLATNSTYFKDPRLIDIFNYIKENLKKGKKFYVEGRLTKREYTDKEGIKRYSTDVYAEKLIPLESTVAQSDNETSESAGGVSEPPAVEGNDDLPF